LTVGRAAADEADPDGAGELGTAVFVVGAVVALKGLNERSD
jgi:hypothetical protein